MTPAQFHPYFADRKHIWLEKCDQESNFGQIEMWLTQPGQSSAELENRKAFMKFYIKMTAPVFGKWNWTKREEANDAYAEQMDRAQNPALSKKARKEDLCKCGRREDDNEDLPWEGCCERCEMPLKPEDLTKCKHLADCCKECTLEQAVWEAELLAHRKEEEEAEEKAKLAPKPEPLHKAPKLKSIYLIFTSRSHLGL